jgi:Domain of unknown function (DUF4786)
MDKLLLSLSFIVLLASLTVNSAPMPSSKIISSIEQQRQKKYGHAIDNDADDSVKIENAESAEKLQQSSSSSNIDDDDDGGNDGGNERPRMMFSDMRPHRQNKMIGYYPYNPYPYSPPLQYPSPAYYPPEFYDDFASFFGYGDDEGIMSRQNSGTRRRPANFKNSPIYYIRLPPTPYMFVPGLGYISQPPTYTPMAPPPPPSISPFYNLPLDFISNGKPTNIYQWGSPAAQSFAPQPQYVPQTPSYPSYQRPQRPYQQRPMNPYLQESKVTNLKGPFLFNGRPEEIFVLPPSSYNSIYPDPRFVSPYY